MTSNQLAAEANRLQEQANREVSRHNMRAEDETNRHNEAVEDLESKNQQLEKQKLNETTRHNATMELIQLEYNGIYNKYVNAEQAQKKQYQEEMVRLEEQKTIAEASYKQNMANYEAKSKEIQQQLAIETERHNKATEYKDFRNIELQDRMNQINERRMLNEATYWEQSVSNAARSNEIRANQINTQAYIDMALMDSTIAKNQAEIARMQSAMTIDESQKQLNEAKAGEAVTNSISNSFGLLNKGLGVLKIISAF